MVDRQRCTNALHTSKVNMHANKHGEESGSRKIFTQPLAQSRDP